MVQINQFSFLGIFFVLTFVTCDHNDPPPPLPISDHEYPRDIVNPARYPGRGQWAQPPEHIDVGFVPQQTYSQVRNTYSVKHLPQSDAIASASDVEEVINAPRLREVVKHTQIREVYEEEGFDDNAYDHGGFKETGEIGEGYETKSGNKRKRSGNQSKPASDSEGQYSEIRDGYEGKGDGAIEDKDTEEKTQSKGEKDKILKNKIKPDEGNRSYKTGRVVHQMEIKTDIEKMMDGDKKGKRIRVSSSYRDMSTDKPTTEVPKSKVYRGRVKNDGIGIVRNVLTDDEVNAGRREDGHSNNHNSTQNMYTGGTVEGKDAIKDNTKEEVTDVKLHRVKLRQLTNRKRESPHLKIVSGKWVKIPQVTNVLKKVMDNNTASASNKRETYSEPDSDEEESDRAPVKGNYLEAHDEEKRLKEEDKIRDQEIEQHYLDTSADIVKGLTKPDKGIDHVKFPFYRTTQNKNSPLRYAMNPREIPLKSGYGMEFYDSKDKHQCEEVKGPGAVVPKRGKDGEWVGQPKAKLPRLSGLGDKIDCFKVKYWGEEPLDNPFFREGTLTSPDQSKRQLIDGDYRDEQNDSDRNKSSEDEANAEFEDFFYGDILKSIKGAETVSFPMINFEHNPDRVKEQVSYHPPSKRPVHSVNLDYDSSEEVDDSSSENRYVTPKPKPTPKPSSVRTYQIPHRNKPPIIKVAKPSIPKYNQIVYPGPKHHKIVLELLPTSSNPSSMQPQFRPSPIDDLSNRQQQQPSNVLHSNSNVIKPKRFHPAKYLKQSPNSLKPHAEVVQSERYRPVTQERQPSNTNVVKDDRYMNIVGMHPPPANVHFKYQTLTLMKSNPSQSKTNSEKKFKRNNFYTGDRIKMVDNMAMANSVVDHVSNLTTLKINHNNERVKRATLFDYEEPVTVRLEEEEPVVKTLRKRKRFRNKKKYRKDEAIDSNNQSDNRKDEENGKEINHERKQIKPYLVKEESQEEDEEEDVGPVRRNRKKNTENRSEENSESTDDRNDRKSQYKDNKDDRRNNNDDSSDRRNNNDPSERRKNNDDSSERRKNNDDSSDRRNNNDDSSERRKNNDDSSDRRNNDNDSSERRNNNDDPSERRNNNDDSSDRRNKNDDPSEESKPYRRRHKKLRKRRPKKYEVYEKQSEEETDGDRYPESNKFHGNSEEYNYPEVNKSQRQTTTEPSYSEEEEDENSKERSQPIRRKKIRRRKRPKQRPRNEEDEDEIENADRRNPSWDKVEHVKKPYPIKEIIDEHVYEKHDFKSDEKSAVNEDIGLHDLRKVHSDTINRLRDRHSGLLGNEKSEEDDEEGQEERKGKDEENEEKEETREKLVKKGNEENEENDGSTEKSVSEEQEGAMEKAGESSSEEITTEKEEQIPNTGGMFIGKKKRTGKGKRRRKEKYSVKESHSEGKSEQDKITDTSTMSPLEEIASQYPKAWKDKKSIDRITERKEIVTTNKNKPEKVEIIKQTTHKNSPETTRGPEEYSVDNRRREPRYKQVVTQDNEEESSNDSHITIHEEVHLSALSGARLPPPIKLSTEEINAKLATLFKGQKFGSRYNAKKPESTLNTMRKLHPEDEGYDDSKTNNTTSESDTKVEGTDKVTLRSRDDSRSRTKNESNESHASVPSKPRTQFSLRSRNITRSRPVLTTTTEAAEPAREETHRSRTQSSHRTKTEDTYKVTVKDVRRSRRPTVKITTASPIVQANHRARSRNRYEGHFVEPISGLNGNAAALTQTNINDIRKLSRKSRDKPTSTQRTGIFDEETAVGVEPPVVTESLKVIDEPVPTTEATTTTTTTTTTVATTTTTKAPRRVFLFNRSKPSTIKPEITSKKSPIFQRPKKPEVVLSKTETRQKVPITLRYNIPVRDVIRESDNNIEVVTEKVKLRYIPPRRQPQPQPVEPTTERVTPRRQQPQPVEPITERITPRRQQPQPVEPTTERVIETTTTEKPRVLTNFETRRVTNQETFTTTHKEDDDDDDDDEDDEDDDDNHDGGNADEDDFYPDASENENYYEHSSQNDADNESSSKVETYEEPHDDWISRNSLSFSNRKRGSGYLNPVDSLTRQSWTRDKTLTYVVDPVTDKGRWIQGRS